MGGERCFEGGDLNRYITELMNANVTANISDFRARELALNPNESFIVQAPAGSGKTSLLVQRYLTLLSKVDAPEEIVAITFTRKAAFEMKRRILVALKNAATSPVSNESNDQVQRVARKALDHGIKHNWNLNTISQRIFVQTIDSLCNKICSATPLLSQCHSVEILEDLYAEEFYRQVTRNALTSILTDAKHHLLPAVKSLLLHLHNDMTQFENLCITMLEKREQWLVHIKVETRDNMQKLRQSLEVGLSNLIEESIENCLHTLPKDLFPEICLLSSFAANNLKIQNDDSKITLLTDCGEKILAKDEKAWRGLIELFLTQKYEWRKTVTKKQGFLSSNHSREMKTRMLNLLTGLKKHELFHLSLCELAKTPSARYSEYEWQIIYSLLELLPFLVNELKLAFNDQGVSDHAGIAMGAFAALLGSSLPIEIILNLEYPIRHLLIDEFQDTSQSQYRLLEKLTHGWQNSDGRTIFLVGDPMQSIYRFREAEVGLFLRSQQEGIGSVRLKNIILTSNFRAQKNIITWINNIFAKVLPKTASINNGAIPFSPSHAVWQNTTDLSFAKVNLLVDGDEQSEAEFLVTSIKRLIEIKNPKETIAVLVKARQHLSSIIPELIRAEIPFQAVELNTLITSNVIRDLFSLTRALISLADRNAWFAILRAPWCGLNLNDLHAIANGKCSIIWENLRNFSELNLSVDGTNRLKRFVAIIAEGLKNLYRLPLRDSIESTWFKLGGPACLCQEEFLENHAKLYFELISKQDSLDLSILKKQIKMLYAPTVNLSAQNCVEIMTIHKAKGLEFDHVFVPGLNRATSHDKDQLFLWQERPRRYSGSDLLLAPIKASGEDRYPVYSYIKYIEQIKDSHELGRLLYVAATRAKKALHLTGVITKDEVDSNKNKMGKKTSFFDLLAPSLESEWLMQANPINHQDQVVAQNVNVSYRLPVDFKMPDSGSEFDSKQTKTTIDKKDFNLCQDNSANLIGIAIHFIFAELSKGKLPVDVSAYIKKSEPYWQGLLLELGMIPKNVVLALPIITRSVTNTLHDKRGRWILNFSHEEAKSEYKITFIDGMMRHLVIDRTFIDQDIRWIIDYKTSVPISNGDTILFLNEQRKLHQKQLEEYAKAISEMESRKCNLGLYFPACSLWVDWTYR